jgi:hypothetical protein
MAKLGFDQRHKITLFNAKGAEFSFPYQIGVLLQIPFGMEVQPPDENILSDVAPNAQWYGIFYPGALNKDYDSQTGTMLLDVKNLTEPDNSQALRWNVDHEDTLLAVATPENEADDLKCLSLADNDRVSIVLEVDDVYCVSSGGLLDSEEFYAKLKPYGEKSGNLIRSQILKIKN